MSGLKGRLGSSCLPNAARDDVDAASRRNNTTAPADGSSLSGTTEVIEEVIDGDGEAQLEEDEEQPPLARGITSLTYSGSRDLGSCKGREGGEAVPQWEANMQLDLAEFDASSVHYLAEGSMCQCFLARKVPASMRLREGAFEAAEAEGVIIKTPTEGGPGMAENDLVVESLVLRELSHPNIVRLLGGGTTATGGSFIVLEYLAMGTLRKRLDNCGGGLGIQPTVKHGQRLASALAYMHDYALPGMMIMHRDLKPDNIGFTASGTVKLMDFGLAKVIKRTLRSCSVKYQMTGETGSPRYMPPEVARSLEYNEKADVWSMTVILWEMVAGRLPFAGQNMQMYLANVCDGGQRPLMQNTWPADFKRMLQAGWQAEPDKRPSFREIDAILTGLQHDFNAPKKKGMFGRG